MSVVAQKLSTEIASNQVQQVDLDEEWSDDKQKKLEDYVKKYVETLTDYPRSFYKRIKWPELINIVGINDQEFLQLKVDEIFDEMIDQWNNEGELDINQITSVWKNKTNPFYREVISMIESVGLETFKVDLPQEAQQNVDNNIVEPEIERKPSAIEIENVQREDVNVQELPRTSNLQSVSSKPHSEMPELTKTQRRLSLDLMHGKPASIKRGDTRFNSLDESILTTPAGAETTTINVITKADVISRTSLQTNQPITDKPNKNRRFSLLGTKKKSKSKGNIKQNNQDKGYTLSSDRRRISLVGEILPLYIRNQLTVSEQQTASHKPSKRQILTLRESPKLAPVTPRGIQLEHEYSPSISSSPRSMAVKSSRLQNLLANSQSLYAHSKDTGEMTAGTYTQTTNTSENTSQRLQYESDEEDREYISPDSLTRYYGIQMEGDEDEEEILNEIEEEEEENGFVNVYGNFYNDTRDTNSVDEIDDDYLFKI